MRVEGIAPRTWLLGTLAGWAIVLWLLALIGMGNRVAILADDPSLLIRLPQLPPAPPERLGPLAQYSEISVRPLFSRDRRPQKFSLTAEGDDNAAPAFDYVLTSVLITPTLSMAIVQPSAGGDSIRVKLGEASEAQPAYRLTTLDPRSAVFEGPDGVHTLQLRVFDGSGGEPPTEMTATDADASVNAAARNPTVGNRAGVASPNAPKPTRPSARPKPAVAPPPPPDEPATADDASATPEEDATAQAQMEGIRRRIEQRRAQLRQEAQDAQNPTAPAKNP